jgi:hypothetical protein
VDASGPSIAEFLLKRATGKVELAFIEKYRNRSSKNGCDGGANAE